MRFGEAIAIVDGLVGQEIVFASVISGRPVAGLPVVGRLEVDGRQSPARTSESGLDRRLAVWDRDRSPERPLMMFGLFESTFFCAEWFEDPEHGRGLRLRHAGFEFCLFRATRESPRPPVSRPVQHHSERPVGPRVDSSAPPMLEAVAVAIAPMSGTRIDVTVVEVYSWLVVVRWREGRIDARAAMQEDFLGRFGGRRMLELADAGDVRYVSGRSGGTESQFVVAPGTFKDGLTVFVDDAEVGLSPLMALPWRRLQGQRHPASPYAMVPLVGELSDLGRAVALELHNDHGALIVADDVFLTVDVSGNAGRVGVREKMARMRERRFKAFVARQGLELSDDVATTYVPARGSSHNANGIARYAFTPPVPLHATRVTVTLGDMHLTAELPRPAPRIGGAG